MTEVGIANLTIFNNVCRSYTMSTSHNVNVTQHQCHIYIVIFKSHGKRTTRKISVMQQREVTSVFWVILQIYSLPFGTNFGLLRMPLDLNMKHVVS